MFFCWLGSTTSNNYYYLNQALPDSEPKVFYTQMGAGCDPCYFPIFSSLLQNVRDWSASPELRHALIVRVGRPPTATSPRRPHRRPRAASASSAQAPQVPARYARGEGLPRLPHAGRRLHAAHRQRRRAGRQPISAEPGGASAELTRHGKPGGAGWGPGGRC